MEEIASKNASSLKLPQMSERQAILYLERSSSNLINPFNSEPRTEVLDYHKYYLFKKKQREKELSKEKLEERRRLYQLSLKEYTPIKKSIYMDRKKKTTYDDEDSLQCDCRPNFFSPSEVEEILRTQYKDKTEDELFGCIEGCQNRAIYLECDENCKCGVSCRNRFFQRQEYADVYPIKTENRGWGLCAGSFIKKDTFIMQYIGEIYSLDSEYGKQKLKEYKDKECTYLMELPNNTRHEVIDPTKKGNMARFINHSCDPNCETRKWHVKNELCIGIFAKRDIQEDEELTFNYDFDLNKTRYQKCLCGAKNCRGYLGISTEDNKKAINRNIVCGICKENCKHSESIIDCKSCGKFFHKKCAKKKGQFSSDDEEYKCAHCIKKSASENYPKNNEINLKEKIKIDEEPIYDEILEIGIEDLQKIKKNLKELINIGAKMFWDFQQENAILGTDDRIDLKISGTTRQIEGVKDAIKELKLKKEETNEYNIKIQVPKIYIRKIIGHQYRNLDSYKSKFGVQILYDTTLITDEIFSIQEYTTIEIKGKESNVKAVAKSIKNYLYSLKIISIYLLEEDYFSLRQKISNLKNSVDPADLRLRKLDSKNEREIKHPFYFISNSIKDIVIIGFENEIEKARKVIKNFLLRQNNLSFNYSLNILFPIYFKAKLSDFLRDNLEENEKNKVKIEATDPEYLRRHISLNIRGRWQAISNIKSKLWKYLKSYAINTIPRKHDINEFEQYAYNQEHKLISKSIRTYIIEQSPQIKNWDYISDDVEYLQQKFFEKKLLGQTSPEKKKEGSDVIENFIYTIDKETRINYLVNMRPGAYKTVFGMSQNDLFEDMSSVLEETYNSYQNSKMENNIDMKSEDYYGFSERDKTYKNDEGFAEPIKINSVLFHQTDKFNNNDKFELNNNNFDSNKRKDLDNKDIPLNNPLSNFSDNKKLYIDSQKSNFSTNNHSSTPSSQYKINTNYKNNDNNNYNSQKINSFLSPLDRNNPNYNRDYPSRYDNYGYFPKKENNDNSSNSSYLLKKTNRPESRSSSERGKQRNNSNNYYDKDMKGYPGKYKNYFRNYDKEYDSYDKNPRKKSPYRDDSFHDNNSNNYNHNNEYPKYSDKGRPGEKGKERDIRRDNERNYERDRDRRRDDNSWFRGNEGFNKNRFDERHRIDYRQRYDDHNSETNNSYINDSYNYRNNYKDSYRNYPQNNRESNYSNRNNSGNDFKNNDNRYPSSKYNYEDGYDRKRFYNDNNFMDKRKGEYKGNSSNIISGNKYSDRQERSRSRSRSWGRNHSRYRRDMVKRDHSHSKSFHKFNDNYE